MTSDSMQSVNGELLHYQACAAIDGTVRTFDLGRRNGRMIPILTPAWTECLPQIHEDKSEENAIKLFRQLSCNLTKVERRTWRKLLVEGQSIAQVAIEEGVSRNAIYERIRGNSKGQGGMIAKNEFVALWWLRRKAEDDDGLY